MNIRATLAAEGLPRRAFTVKDVERMVEVGLIEEDERLELLGGELVPMSPKGSFHEAVKLALNERLVTRKPASVRVIPETTLRLSEDTFIEPDFIVYDASRPLRDLTGPDALLAIEVADTSLGYDLGRKPKFYAAFGIPEMWVIDARRMRIHIHRRPDGEAYREITVHDADAEVVPESVPELSLRLAELDLGP